MLSNDAGQRPRWGWVRYTLRALTAAALFAVPLVALAQLGPGLVPGLMGNAAAAATPINPLTFDAPARTVEQAAAEEKDENRAAARLAAATQEEATVLDDWHFTGDDRRHTGDPLVQISYLDPDHDHDIDEEIIKINIFHHPIIIVIHFPEHRHEVSPCR